MFFLVTLGLWTTERWPRYQLLLGQQKSPWSCYLIFLPDPDNWVMGMQKMWSCLGKRWCKHKAASPGRQCCGRRDDKAGHCHCWDEFSIEKCFWNAYGIPHPWLIVWDLRSIPLQQRFPMSWNKTKHGFTGVLPFKSTHFPVKWRSVINYISDSLRISLSCSVLAV